MNNSTFCGVVTLLYAVRLLVEDVNRQDEITAIINGIITDSTHKRTFGKEITYTLPIHQSARFAGKGFL